MKYSVLMSVYYKEKPEFLKVSIESMLQQTIKPNQIVIVKDGPLTKELDNVLEEFFNKEKNFTIVALKKNLGLGLALNEGIKACRNELIARMDSDDISLPQRCEIQITEFLRDLNLQIVGSHTNEFIDNPKKVIRSRVVPINNEEILKFSRRRNPFNHPTVMYKKSAVLNVGGYRDEIRVEDIDLFVRMLNNGCKAKNINESLLLFRSNEDNLKRRKSWIGCKNYIKIIYKFRKKGYSKTKDLIFVTCTQVFMFLSPKWLVQIISDRVLRKCIKN